MALGVFRNSISVVAATISCLALLLTSAVTPVRATEPGCDSATMYVAAHADDTLLFQSPSLLQDVYSERCVRTVFVTAGDAGRPVSYWGKREDGAEAAYAQMAGVADEWDSEQIVVDGHSIRLVTLEDQPKISIAYLRLPDGGTSGSGFSLYGNESLTKLWRSVKGGSPSIVDIEAVDDSSSYDFEQLVDVLAVLMDSFEPSQVATQNYTQALVGPDHADHVATAKFAREAAALYGDAHRLLAFEDYEISAKPQNVFGELLGAKSFAFYTYGAHDSDACDSESHCAETAYSKWLLREYVADTETSGVVAHAGYRQIVTPSTEVTLDGSQSSGEGGGTLGYAWTQIGGPTVTLSGANTSAPSFTTPSHPTLLTFALTVEEGATSGGPDVVRVRVPSSDPTPTAVADPTQTVESGAGVTLDGSGSWDPNSLPLQYAWLQTAGPAVVLSGSSTAKPTFTAPTGPATLKFSLAVSNGNQTSALATTTVTVKGVAPSFTSANSATFTTGVNKSFTISTAGSPTAAIAKTAGSLPSGLAFKDNGDGTATISGTAAASEAPPAETKNYALTLKASSAAGEASQSFTLTVANPGVAPSFTSASSTTFTTGVAKTFTISTSGSPAAAIANTSGTLPSGLTLTDNGDGTATVSGTAAISEAPPAGTKNYALTLKASSAAGEASQSFTLTVANPGVAPSFTSASSTTFATGVAKSFTVSTAGSPAAAIAKTAGSLPSGLTLTDNGDGMATISGTAATAAAPPASTQNYPLTLEASSAAGSASQSFTLTVSNPGTAPSFTSADATTFTTGVEKSFTVSTTGAPTAVIAKSVGSLPSGLTFTDNGDGTATISGTAAEAAAPPGSTQNYGLTFEATSAAGDATQSFTLTMSNPGVVPAFASADATTFTAGVAKSFTVSTTGSPTAAIAKAAGALPGGLSFTDNGDGTATISGTADPAAAPPASSQGYPLTLEASSAAGSASQSFTLTVANPGVAPAFMSADSTSFSTGVAGSFTVTTTGAPIAGLAKTGALPSGLTFTDNGDGTATISGTAGAGSALPESTRDYPLTLEASSAAGSATQDFTLSVHNPEQEPPEPPVIPPVVEDQPPVPLPPPALPSPAAKPPVTLSHTKVRLLVGKRTRHLVRVTAWSPTTVHCSGELPRGARCRVTEDRNLVIEGSSAVRRVGTYRLMVLIADERGVQSRSLVVQVKHPGDRDVARRHPSSGAQRP